MTNLSIFERILTSDLGLFMMQQRHQTGDLWERHKESWMVSDELSK